MVFWQNFRTMNRWISGERSDRNNLNSNNLSEGERDAGNSRNWNWSGLIEYNKKQSKIKTGKGDIVTINSYAKSIYIIHMVCLIIFSLIVTYCYGFNLGAIICIGFMVLCTLYVVFVLHLRWLRFDADGFDKRVWIKRTKRYTWTDITKVKYKSDKLKIYSRLGNVKVDVSFTNYELFRDCLEENTGRR